ncbi:hypothetical protein DMA12_17995 [Amycolatopsis balhimycina DSM 5908]|uniref:Uncharacterized protein n=1 Tax=Amycolatopsis balhimycina DSM 5908 TaxID=1081091 RepID=A0A428WLD2_AMYBA|nr:hypothetical protein DMA12_17995 [Amycolatopsis balhimycina DSM 5908]
MSSLTSDSSLFSHPVIEEPHPGALTAPQEHRYGSLFLQPVGTAAPPSGGNAGSGPQRRPRAANPRAHDPSGRRAR